MEREETLDSQVHKVYLEIVELLVLPGHRVIRGLVVLLDQKVSQVLMAIQERRETQALLDNLDQSVLMDHSETRDQLVQRELLEILDPRVF